MKILRILALIGNSLYILWILYNGIDEGFRAIHTVEAVSLIGLVVLLVLNILLIRRSK